MGQYEVMLLYSLNLASWAIAGFFLFSPFNTLSRKILTGEFDDVLTKPLNPFWYLIAKDATIDYVSNLTVAFSAFLLCLYKLNVTLGIWDWFLMALLLIGATLIQAALFILPNLPAFWIVKIDSIRQLFQSDLGRFIRYPISAYPKSIQILLTVVLPYAFINFFPAHVILGKPNETMFFDVMLYLTPLVGIVLIVVAYRLWLFSLKHYTSTGS
ncbi:ABC transporter permease [Paenibacillus sp. strain BS8-2]